MVEKRQVYKCLVCGIVAEVLDVGAGQMFCCSQPMRLMTPHDEPDAMHTMVVRPADGGVAVRVGAQGPHPMEPKHHIQWIELVTEGGDHRCFLGPDDEPEAFFPAAGLDAQVRGFCNLHGLLKG